VSDVQIGNKNIIDFRCDTFFLICNGMKIMKNHVLFVFFSSKVSFPHSANVCDSTKVKRKTCVLFVLEDEKQPAAARRRALYLVTFGTHTQSRILPVKTWPVFCSVE
jgi:hypothetical protein